MAEELEPSGPLKVFYSYSRSRKDRKLRDKLEGHLKGLERDGLIRCWHDGAITAGGDWEAEIYKQLNEADIILLLISADFIASNFCYNREMPAAMQRHSAGQAHVIPIILRPCDWQSKPFAKLQVLPDSGLPIVEWKNRDYAFLDVVEGIKAVIKEDTNNVSPARRPPVPAMLPYFCDRINEEQELIKTVLEIKGEMLRRSLICIIHGDEDERPDMFRVQLQEKSLLRFLKRVNPDEYGIKDLPLRISSAYKSVEDFQGIIRRNLAVALGIKDATVLDKRIASALSKYKTPVIVYWTLSTDDWGRDGPELIKAFIQYWGDFPDVRRGLYLINCLIFTYITKKGFGYRKRNAHARDFLGNLEFGKFGKVSGITLDLGAVKRREVEDWMRDRTYFGEFCEVHRPEFCNTDDAIKEIRDLFNDRGLLTSKGLIPMEPLAKELKGVLKRNRC